MKTFCTLLFTTLVASGLLAQPTINSDVVFQLGESSKVELLEGFYDPGDAGMDQTWDFSNIGSTFSWSWRAANPDTLVFKDSFPTATLSFLTPVGDTANNYIFYRFVNDSLYFLGAAIAQASDTVFQILDRDPLLTLDFPFTYLDTTMDDFAGTNHVKFQGTAFLQTRDGSVSHNADAYGTIHTPLGTFTNALRVKTVEMIYDTLRTAFPVASQQVITRYAWYTATDKYLIMQMDSIVNIQTGMTNVVKHAQYRSEAVSVGLEESQFAERIGLSSFPNPAQGHLRVRFELPQPTTVRLSLHNFLGQTLKEVELGAGLYGSQLHQMDLSGIAAGTYLLRLSTPQHVAATTIQIR